MTKEEFKNDALAFLEVKPMEWRNGQAIFNYIDKKYGALARKVQFEDGIDCFYLDAKIDEFLDACYNNLEK